MAWLVGGEVSKLVPVEQNTEGGWQVGLYRREEHDACGVGFVADLNAPASHRVVEQALECLGCLTHRGGVDADGASGDGAGIAVQLPSEFFAREALRLNSGFQPHWRMAVGVFFFPRDGVTRARAMFIAEEAIRNRSVRRRVKASRQSGTFWWRNRPIRNANLNRTSTSPVRKSSGGLRKRRLWTVISHHFLRAILFTRG